MYWSLFHSPSETSLSISPSTPMNFLDCQMGRPKVCVYKYVQEFVFVALLDGSLVVCFFLSFFNSNVPIMQICSLLSRAQFQGGRKRHSHFSSLWELVCRRIVERTPFCQSSTLNTLCLSGRLGSGASLQFGAILSNLTNNHYHDLEQDLYENYHDGSDELRDKLVWATFFVDFHFVTRI